MKTPRTVEGANNPAIDLLVGSTSARSSDDAIRYEVHSSLFTPGAFCRIGPQVYVCSPELVILLMSRWLNDIETLQLMYELCGSYSICDNEKGHISRKTLTSIRRVISFAEQALGFRGVKRVLELSNYVLDNSASPMESACSMTLLSPRRLGGYTLRKKPCLNMRINVPKRATKVIQKEYLVADLAWPEQRLVVEYDSTAEHGNMPQIDRDNNRRAGLKYLGYAVVTITKQRFRSPADFNKVYLPIAQHLGLRIRKEPQSTVDKRDALLWKLRRPVAF